MLLLAKNLSIESTKKRKPIKDKEARSLQHKL